MKNRNSSYQALKPIEIPNPETLIYTELNTGNSGATPDIQDNIYDTISDTKEVSYLLRIQYAYKMKSY